MTTISLIIYGLATFRLALLLSSDTAPWGIASKLRSFLKREAKTNQPLRQSKIHLGVSCLRCSSVWMATPIAAYAVFRHTLPQWLSLCGDTLLLLLALSGMAILVNRALPGK